MQADSARPVREDSAMECSICDKLTAEDWLGAMNELASALRDDPPNHVLDSHLLGRRCLFLKPFIDRKTPQSGSSSGDTSILAKTWRDSVNRLLDPSVQMGLLHYYGTVASKGSPSHRRLQAEMLLNGLVNAHHAATCLLVDSRGSWQDFVMYATRSTSDFQQAYPDMPPVEELVVCDTPLPGMHGKQLRQWLQDIVGRGVRHAVGYQALRRVLLHLLSVDAQSSILPSPVSTPVLLYDRRTGSGIVAEMSASARTDGVGRYFFDPVEMAMVCLDREFLHSARQAWDQTKNHREDWEYSVCLNVRPVAFSIEGNSLGAAMACAMRALFNRWTLHSDRVVSAALPDCPGGHLRDVGSLAEKLEAANARNRTTRRIDQVVVSQGVAPQLQTRGREYGITVEPAGTLDEAYHHVRLESGPPMEGEPPLRASVPSAPQQIGNYELLAEIGHGPYRTVYRARPVDGAQDQVALAEPHNQHPEEIGEQRKGFERLRAVLDHPGFIQILDVAPPSVEPFHVVYEFADGQTLAEHLTHGTAPSSIDDVCELVVRIGRALEIAHDKDLAHGNLTPREIVLTKEGQPKILDVGRLGVVRKVGLNLAPPAGSERYQAPEARSLSNSQIGPPADLWSLAVIAYELATGHHPFERADWQADWDQLVPSMLPTPAVVHRSDIPPGFAAAIERALMPSPEERFASVGDFLRALQRGLQRTPPVGGFVPDLEIAIEAGSPLLYVETGDEITALSRLQEVGERLHMKLHVWRLTTGVTEGAGLDGQSLTSPADPVEALAWLADSREPAILALLDYDAYLDDMPLAPDGPRGMRDVHGASSFNPPPNHGTEDFDRSDMISHTSVYDDPGDCPAGCEVFAKEQVARRFRDLAENLRRTDGVPKTAIVVAPATAIPQELSRDVQRFTLEPVRFTEVNDALKTALASNNLSEPPWLAGSAMEYTWHAGGLSLEEIGDSLRLSIVRRGGLTPRYIEDLQRDKEQIVRRHGILELWHPTVSLKDVVGLDNLKLWLEMITPAMQSPIAGGGGFFKGLLLGGMPGCGKSFCAKAIAGQWGWPLLRLDAGRIFEGLLGRSEQNMRVALDLAGAMSPVVMWVDEIEKGFGQSRGASSTTMRVFQTFLTWLQERTECVFLVATANDDARLPPELLRAGRFDQPFFLDLPNEREREALLKQGLRVNDRSAGGHDFQALAQEAEGFSSAELLGRVENALYVAAADGRRDPAPDELHSAITDDPPPVARRGRQARWLKALRATWLSFAAPASPPY